MGHGFREVIIDQPFTGKWTEVDMNLGGGHGTFQGTKFSDCAGGFSYWNSLVQTRYAVQNRFMYWRILNDVLEMTETSMDYNLEDNQLRIKFPDSPIVCPISVQETENTVVILVMTVTSVNRFIFAHPTKVAEDSKPSNGNRLPSIFQQATSRPIMKFSSFSLFEHTINVPVPTTGSSCIMPHKTGHIFAMAYESGGITICKITKEDSIICYDLRQSNLLTKILSYTPSILRPSTNQQSLDAVVGLYFFTCKIVHEKKDLFLVTLSVNGHLRLYICNNLHTIDSWALVNDVIVDKRFSIGGFTDSTMVLRKYQNGPKDYPMFIVFIPGEGFKMFQCLRDTNRSQGLPKLILGESSSITFKEKALIDFCVTSDHLFTLVNNPMEETDWEVKSHDLNSQQQNPRFNLALLEPPPRSEVFAEVVDAEPKEFYTDLIFNKSPFSVTTIYSALSMFKNSMSFPKPENDWELTKLYALRVIDSEIRAITAESDEPVADDEFRELNFKFWGEFYTSCVEYHVNTVKPLGIFYETNTHLLTIVKKSRVSFLRPTDFLETAFYFPHLITGENSVIPANRLPIFQKYLEILELLESTIDEFHTYKISKRIYQDKQDSMTVWDELASFLVDADPHVEEVLERRHFVSMLTKKLREFGANGTGAMKYMIDLLSSWDVEARAEAAEDDEEVSINMDTNQSSRVGVSQYFMGSRLGANLAYRIITQLLNVRYIMGRNMLLLQAILDQLSKQPEIAESGIHMKTSLPDREITKFSVYRTFSLLGFCDRMAEFVYENWSENSRKVAALLNCASSDQLTHGKIPEFWPMKLFEFFAFSTSGGLAIRSRVFPNRQPTAVLAYASAVGRTLWMPEDSADQPFEEFLISAGQYNALAAYSNQLKYYRTAANQKPVLGLFYKGISDLFLRNPLAALSRFMSISPEELHNIPYFTKLLGIQDKPEMAANIFFEKAIHLFQVFMCLYGVQRLTGKALTICEDDRSRRIMSVLGFKSALALGDYENAFQFILQMPKESQGANGQKLRGKEREASIRTFVIRVLENRDVDVLVGLVVNDFTDTTRDEIEKVLHSQAKLSDPMAEEGVYQMVYFYYLSRSNFEKAAMVLLERIIEIGLKGKGRQALEIQKDCYLDILSCIALIKGQEQEKVKGHVGSGDSEDVDIEDFLMALENVKLEESVPNDEYYEIRQSIKSYENMKMECELCISLLLLKDDKDVGPIKDLKSEKAKTCIGQLIQCYQYDQAIKLATMWKHSYLPIVSAFAQACVNMLNISTENGDIDYIKYLDTEDLPNSNLSAADIGFLILKKYITTLENDKETKLHKETALILLRHCVSLPRWLVDSYKRRDVNQLMLCYMRFGDWEEAADLAMEVLDISLGRRECKGFDPSIQIVSPYIATPIIPYTTIEDLANQMKEHLPDDPQLGDLLQNLREKCDDFVVRVLETRMDRRLMFAN